MEEVNLPEDPSPAVRGDLVDHLRGVLDPGEEVCAGLDPGVGPLPQHLAQGVQLVERVAGEAGGAGRFLLFLPLEDSGLLPGRGCCEDFQGRN